ncbi:MAG: toxin, partial [Staphylococcus epidermidis]|nr:toxin [Staphylococcus epidermidis]
MSRYEQLLSENEHIKIRDTHSLPNGYSGFYKDGVILIDKNLPE